MTQDAREIAGKLTESARLALCNWHLLRRPTWWEITEAAGPTANGRSRAYRHCVLPLEREKLVRHDNGRRRADGTRTFRRYDLTPLGLAVRAVLMEERS